MINRREALRRTSYIVGGVLSASTIAAVMSGCKPKTIVLDWTPEIMTPDQALTVAEITERIIPTTNTPGAKAAMVDRFIDAFLKDIASQEEQAEFSSGISAVNDLSVTRFKKKFTELSVENQDAILTEISGPAVAEKSDEELADELANEGEQVLGSIDSDLRFFNMMRQLTITGYFTSEIGAKEALKFDEIPGTWQGCVPYEEIGGAWAL